MTYPYGGEARLGGLLAPNLHLKQFENSLNITTELPQNSPLEWPSRRHTYVGLDRLYGLLRPHGPDRRPAQTLLILKLTCQSLV